MVAVIIVRCVRLCVCEQASLLMNPEDKVWVVISLGHNAWTAIPERESTTVSAVQPSA